jgi:RNA polymerase sigma factor (sigma-70 family)
MKGIQQEFAESKPQLRRYLARFLGPADVEDLLQEVFLRAYSAELKRPILMPRAYLFRIAKHAALNELARRRNSFATPIEEFSDPDVVGSGSQPDIEQDLEGRRRLALFSRAVASLPDQCRKVFVLRKVEGLSQAEIARRLGLAESTVEKHLAKGMLLTRDYMARAEAGGEPDAIARDLAASRRAHASDARRSDSE